jgi:hypothetical protein
MKIQGQTLFDCSATGITGHFRSSQVPFLDLVGQTIHDIDDWNRARNQQRNWETLQQMISLRAQPVITQPPRAVDDHWEFEFEIETPGVYSATGEIENLDGLLNECAGIPMVIDLNEKHTLEPCLTVNGPNQNLWFKTINN